MHSIYTSQLNAMNVNIIVLLISIAVPQINETTGKKISVNMNKSFENTLYGLYRLYHKLETIIFIFASNQSTKF